MNFDAISRAVITAQHLDSIERKQLNQTHRKLLLLCCEILKNQKRASQIKLRLYQIEDLITTLENIRDQAPKKRCSCIRKIFSAIANILHLRIGTSRLEKQLHLAFKHFPKTNSSSIYYEMIDKAMEVDYQSSNQRSHVLATLEKIYLLSVHQIYFNTLTNDQLLIYLTDKIGLRFRNIHTSLFPPFNHLEVQGALNSIKSAYELAKNKNLQEFFKNAFNIEDDNFNDCLSRIRLFLLTNRDTRDLPSFSGSHIPFLEADMHESFTSKTKEEYIFDLCWNFRESQLKKYAKDFELNDEAMSEEEKKEIMEQSIFLTDYATHRQFIEFIKEYPILGMECSDGFLTPGDYLPLINGLLEKKLISNAYDSLPHRSNGPTAALTEEGFLPNTSAHLSHEPNTSNEPSTQ